MTTYGTAHLFGVSGTISNATVVDFKLDEESANRNKTEDESGNMIEDRFDDNTKTGSITIRIRTLYTIPTVPTVLTYETVKYKVTKVGRVQQNKAHRTVQLDIETSEFITLP